MAFDFDLVVIGGGPAGEKGAAQAAYFGKRVAVVERAPSPGGAAVHTGTLPSKTLRETSMVLSGYRQSELYGLTVELNREMAVPKLLSRKNAVRDLEVARIHWNLERHGVPLVPGRGEFVDAHTLKVVGSGVSGQRIITAENFLVCTGSVPHQPSDIPFDDIDIDDSDTVLLLDRLPARMVVIGGGVIGCEYASIFATLGVKVTLVEPRDRLLPFLDNEIGERLRCALMGLGVRMRLGVTYKQVVRDDEFIVTQLSDGTDLVSEKLLFAAGRSGRTRDLGITNLEIETDKRGYIKVDTNYCTKVPNIYAAGDVIGFPALASTGMEQARVAVCHMFGIDYKKQVSELLPYGIYTIPEVSCVGLSEEDARSRNHDVVVGRAFFRDNARGKIVGDRDGVIKLVFDRQSRKLLGCHCLGDRASELVHIGQAVIALGGGVDTLIEMVFNYPTLGESYKYAAYDALGRWSAPA